jgi:thiol:disulfide interchange protein DsbD
MKYLPKPGSWMETAKQFMGFLMMATLIWLLYILGKQLGMEAVIWTTAFLLTVGLACWIVGRFATLTVTRAKYITTWIVAGTVVMAGYWWFMETVLDVRSVIAGTSPAIQTEGRTESQGIKWKPFSLDGLEASLRENKTVFIDFTADWCLTCKVNEKAVMSDEEVADKFRSAGIVAIRADWTNRNPEITRLLARFGRSGVPLYVLFPAGKPTKPIVLPEVITKSIVIDAIERASNGTALKEQ